MFTVTKEWQLPVNLLVVAVFIFCVAEGWKKGLLRSVLSFCSMFLSLWLAGQTNAVFAGHLDLLKESPVPLLHSFFNRALWFLLLFVIYRFLFFLLDRVLKKLHKITGIRQISEILGAFFGALQAGIWCLLFIVVLNTPLFIHGESAVNGTVLGMIQNVFVQEIGSREPRKLSSAVENGMKTMSKNEKTALKQWLKKGGEQK